MMRIFGHWCKRPVVVLPTTRNGKVASAGAALPEIHKASINGEADAWVALEVPTPVNATPLLGAAGGAMGPSTAPKGAAGLTAIVLMRQGTVVAEPHNRTP